MSDITLDQAHDAVKAARKKLEEMDVKMDIAVVDAGANLKFFIRMDEAWLGSIDIAIKKAKTARFFNMNTGDIGGLSQPGWTALQYRTLKWWFDYISGRRSTKECGWRSYWRYRCFWKLG